MRFVIICLLFLSCTSSKQEVPAPPPVAALAPTPEPSPTPRCFIADILGDFLARQAVTAMECKNSVEVQKFITAKLYLLNLCEESQQGLPEFICPHVATLVKDVSLLAIPKNWECKGGIPAQFVHSYVLKKCMERFKSK